MGGEESAHKFHQSVGHLLGVDDVHLRNVLALNVAEAGVVGNLAECRGQRQRIAAEFCTACIGHVLPFAGDGKSREHHKEIGDAGADGSDDHDRHRREAVVPFVAIAAAEAAEPHAVVDHPDHQRQHGGDDAHEDDARDEQAGVAVADMRQFVADHACQFLIVQTVQQACRHRDGIRVLVDTATLGMSIPQAMQRFSTMLYTLGFSLRISGWAPTAFWIIFVLLK